MTGRHCYLTFATPNAHEETKMIIDHMKQNTPWHRLIAQHRRERSRGSGKRYQEDPRTRYIVAPVREDVEQYPERVGIFERGEEEWSLLDMPPDRFEDEEDLWDALEQWARLARLPFSLSPMWDGQWTIEHICEVIDALP
jgi:hypothetical protein